MTRFTELPDLVLGPLAGRPDADWLKAPPGKWTSAQIVEHLAIALDTSSHVFEDRRARDPMHRRPRTWKERLAYAFILGLRWFPPGRKAPAQSTPTDHPDPTAVVARFRTGVERFLALEKLLLPARRYDLFVKHPRLGDLNLEEWMRFHVVHSRHHAKQIRERLRG
ncbi:MAG: DinB family protein [Gemmatimonadales bacterium]